MGEYYCGWLLGDTVNMWDLTDSDKRLLDAAIYQVDNKSTIRDTARNFNFTRSTYHRLIHTRLKLLSYELYQSVFAVLFNNIKH